MAAVRSPSSGMTVSGPDLQAPLIVIGAGRSGTTLLMRALSAHPQMSFHGENDFLAPRLWRETVGNRSWHDWERQFKSNASSSRATAPLPPLHRRALAALEAHAGLAAAEHVARLLGVGRACAAWGYKELWNGSVSFDHPWSTYDGVFPRAAWLHLVRDPFAFATSAARWNVRPLTRAHLRELLVIWTAVQERSRERWETGRYSRIRYEDMVADPQGTLAPILASLGLDWRAACGEVFSAPHFQSAGSWFGTAERVRVRAEDFSRSVPRFLGQCEDLGYLEPREIEIEDEHPAVLDRAHPAAQ